MKRRWLIASGLSAALLVAAAIAFEPLVRHVVVTRARDGGVALEAIDDIRLRFGRITLSGVRFSLIGVRGLEGEAAHLELELSGLRPTKIIAREMKLELVGSAVDLLLALGVWTDEHPELWRLPADVADVTLRWRPAKDADPWLAARGARIVPTERGARLEAERASVLGIPVGRVGAAWDSTGASASFGFGEDDVEKAPLRAVIHHAARPARLEIALDPVAIRDLAGPLAIFLPIPDVRASGKADLTLHSGGAIDGTIVAKFEGYRVPVPRELSAFVFGDTTIVKTQIAIDSNFTSMRLDDIEAHHGAVKLFGAGTIDRRGTDALIDLTLKGSLGCSELAAAATRTHVPGEIGRALGGLAGKALLGSVGFTITIRADSRNLLAAKIGRQIGVGCGLRPLSLDDLPKLADELPKVADELPNLPEKLPKMLENLPSLPLLPQPRR
jgi:hypothetical protein